MSSIKKSNSRKRVQPAVGRHESPPSLPPSRSRLSDAASWSKSNLRPQTRALRVNDHVSPSTTAAALRRSKRHSSPASNCSPSTSDAGTRRDITAGTARIPKCRSRWDVVNSGADSRFAAPKKDAQRRRRRESPPGALPRPNKVAGGSDRRPSAAGGVDFEHKRKRFSCSPRSASGRKKGHREAEPEELTDRELLKKPRPVVRNRNTTRRKGAISTPVPSSFPDSEAEEAPGVGASSSRNVSSTRTIERANGRVDNQPPPKKNPKTAAEKGVSGSKFATSPTLANSRRTVAESGVKRRRNAATISSTSSDSGTGNGKGGGRNRRIERKKITRRVIGKKMPKTEVGATATEPDSIARWDFLPKRKASLDAHSAMVAMTLQMQRPILRSTHSGLARKRTDSATEEAAKSSASSTILKRKKRSGDEKAVSNRGKQKTSGTKPVQKKPRATAKKRAAATKSVRPRSATASPKKAKLDSSGLPEPPVASIFSHTVQCTCQSPPACPLHYQLQCACHPPQFHHHQGAAAAMGFVGGTSAQAPSAALISSIFPFQTTPSSTGLITAATAATGAGASIPHYSAQQQQPGSWHAPPWPFATAAHMLATVATPNTSVTSTPAVAEGVLSAGFPAVFQGHLFIGPHPPPASFHLHQTSSLNLLTPASLFVNTDSSNLALHSQPEPQPACARHPTPPLISCAESVVDSGGAEDFGVLLSSNPSFATIPNQQQASIPADMVAKNRPVYELIQGVDMSPSLTLKLAKNGSEKKIGVARKRKSSNSSGGSGGAGEEQSKKKKQKSARKSSSYDFEQISSKAATSSWQPVGAPMRKWVYVNNDTRPLRRDCYAAISHKLETDTIIRVRDCVVVKSGETSSQSQQCNESGTPSKRSYIGKVADFFTSPNGALWVSLAWYYWPEQAEVTSVDDQYLFQNAHPKELLASRHIDCISADSIEDVAYVVSINEYNRYVSENNAESQCWLWSVADEIVPRAWGAYPRRRLMPAEDTDDGLVYFCRRVYDFHGKRILRNPSF